MKDYMKKCWQAGIALALLSAPLLTGCDDEDEDQPLINNTAITQTATNRYPGAQVTDVERDAQGYEITMYLNGAEVEMYITADYAWRYTEFEDVAWTQLPEAIQAAFAAEGYTFNALEDDVDRIEYPDGDSVGEYYRIELDREPTDIVLSYNPDGSRRL